MQLPLTVAESIICYIIIIIKIDGQAYRLGRSLFLLQNRFLALVRVHAKSQPIWINFAYTYCYTEYTCGPT